MRAKHKVRAKRVVRGRPRGGYNNANKVEQRTVIYATASALLDPRTARALLLPAVEGDEVGAALAGGFRQRNLCLVDKEHSVTRRLKEMYGHGAFGATCIERDVVEACREIKERGWRLGLLNLDLCGPVTTALPGAKGTNEKLAEIVALGVLDDPAVVAVTISVGHETRGWKELPADRYALQGASHRGRPLTESDRQRLAIVTETMSSAYHGRVVTTGKHRSSVGPAQSILWIVFHVTKRRVLIDHKEAT